MTITKSQAISNFLRDHALPDLSRLYNIEMECQVNVARDNGEPISGEFNGKKWKGWTDGTQEWKSFRIPFNAATTPTYEDKSMTFDLSKHVEAIGMTGWNWQLRRSMWVAFDFDAITGHSDIHTRKLTDEELKKIISLLENIPWVQIRRSASGKGLHIYVYLFPYIETQNHHEHAALARAILSKLSAIVCFDFKAKVDICGGNMWVWHRKATAQNLGFTVIKDKSENLTEVPINWKDHIKVVKGAKKRVTPDFIVKSGEDTFEQLCGQNLRIDLDEEHMKLIDYLKSKGDAVWWWDTERHMLVTHTVYLKEAHEALTMRGIFDTDSKGSERGSDHNCYAFPLRNGGWTVRRFSPGCAEKPTWKQDKAGWTMCFLNKLPDLGTAARSKGGVELPNSAGYQFSEAELAVKTAEALGTTIEIPTIALTREAILKEQKDGRLVVELQRENSDNPKAMEGWAGVGKKWKRVFETQSTNTHEVETPVCDDIVRHVVTEIERANGGWYVNSDGHWQKEPLEHVRPFLKSFGHNPNLIEPIIGLCIQRAWREVNRPFEQEYPGNRDWNRRGAKLRFVPNPDHENLKYPSWQKILNHLGKTLTPAMKNNEWAVANGILTGADYLKCWVAALFQKPFEPLPYLFFFGPQDCGKSTFPESLELLFTRGFIKADHALVSQSGFNGELANAILCLIEETDLSKAKFAYNRVKDWVTGKNITIHEKGKTPYTLPNTTKWIQCANSHTFCPTFVGDTRITMISVEPLGKFEAVPKKIFFEQLEKEAPDFLASILSLELPDPVSRLSIPVVTTAEKISVENMNESLLDKFVNEKCFQAPGKLTLFSETFEAFMNWLPAETRGEWNKSRFSKEFPTRYPKGYHTANKTYIGNMSLTKVEDKDFSTPWTLNSKGQLEVQK